MKLKELKDYLDTLSERDLQRELVIPVVSPGTIGPSASLPIAEIFLGFDWNQGVAFLHTEKEVTQITPEQVSAIYESVSKGQSWHHMEKIKELKARTYSHCPNCAYVLDPVQAEKDAIQEEKFLELCKQIHEENDFIPYERKTKVKDDH